MCIRGVPSTRTHHTGAQRTPRGFSLLKIPSLSINAPFISPSNSCKSEHRNDSAPWLHNSSENSSHRKPPESIPNRASFVSRVLVLSALSQRTHSPPNSRSARGVHSPDTIERLGLSQGRGCVPDVVLALNEILKICAQERSYLLSTYNMPSAEMHATGNLGKSGRRKEGKKGQMKIEEAFSRARRSG